MDLLATVRKEGSRGGRGDFKWSDVQTSSHRENYLGHSVMAPVGRWQRGRDLTWYSKADADSEGDAAEKANRERQEELRRVKEAEQDAMARALGLPVPDRTNANLEQVSDKREFDKVLQEAGQDGYNNEGGARGVGFSRAGVTGKHSRDMHRGERIEGTADAEDKELQYALREHQRRQQQRHSRHEHNRDRDRDRDRDQRRIRRRSRSRSRSRSKSRDHNNSPSRQHRRDRSRQDRRRRPSLDTRDNDRHQRPPPPPPPRSRSRSRSRSRDRDRDYNIDQDQDRYRRRKRRDRSRSPNRPERDSTRWTDRKRDG